ncbi:HAD family hydrolase [Rhodoferax koreense]|nr:HAD-IA family hydrolase [Rhodoferax koreense]
MLDLTKIRAISLDLDDTLWPIWPTIARAEQVLLDWLKLRAPATAGLFGSPEALREIRNRMHTLRPDLHADLSALRRESIRLALQQANEDGTLAEEAFEVFFAERQRVDLFDDVLPALDLLAARYPLVALTNGNADIARVGLGAYFTASITAREFGVAKPDARIFEAAARAADVAPEQVLHVGDDALLDVLGALGAGMQAVWVNRTDQLWQQEMQPHAEVASLAELGAMFAHEAP